MKVIPFLSGSDIPYKYGNLLMKKAAQVIRLGIRTWGYLTTFTTQVLEVFY
jgi:hypothetical protein